MVKAKHIKTILFLVSGVLTIGCASTNSNSVDAVMADIERIEANSQAGLNYEVDYEGHMVPSKDQDLSMEKTDQETLAFVESLLIADKSGGEFMAEDEGGIETFAPQSESPEALALSRQVQEMGSAAVQPAEISLEALALAEIYVEEGEDDLEALDRGEASEIGISAEDVLGDSSLDLSENSEEPKDLGEEPQNMSDVLEFQGDLSTNPVSDGDSLGMIIERQESQDLALASILFDVVEPEPEGDEMQVSQTYLAGIHVASPKVLVGVSIESPKALGLAPVGSSNMAVVPVEFPKTFAGVAVQPTKARAKKQAAVARVASQFPKARAKKQVAVAPSRTASMSAQDATVQLAGFSSALFEDDSSLGDLLEEDADEMLMGTIDVGGNQPPAAGSTHALPLVSVAVLLLLPAWLVKRCSLLLQDSCHYQDSAYYLA